MEKASCPMRKPCATVRDAIGRDHVDCLKGLNYYMGHYEVISQCARKGSVQCLRHHLQVIVGDPCNRKGLERSRAYMENIANVATKQNRLDVLRELRTVSFWCFDGYNIWVRAREGGNWDIVRWCLDESLLEDPFNVTSLVLNGNLKMTEWFVERGPVDWPADLYWDAFAGPASLRMAECLWRHGAPLGDIVTPNKCGEALLDLVLKNPSVPTEAIVWLRERGAQWTQESLACGAFGDRDLPWMLAQGCPVGSKETLSRVLSHRVPQLDWAASVPLELDSDAVVQEATKWGKTETLDWLIQRGQLVKDKVDVSLCQFALNRERMAKWKVE
ncbi:hypothetical protein [Mollivirus kamchatka]|nr:hypothetical protein [Mollivirus kamchatka]